MSRTAWNWKGKTAFFWAGFNALCIIWIFFRLPEPKGLTYAQLDTVSRVVELEFLEPFYTISPLVVA